MNQFTEQFVQKHSKILTEEDLTLKCTCVKKHSKGCGCMSTAFISRAVLNHSAALVQSDKDPAKCSKVMEDLGSHHAKDEHIWGEEPLQSCSFHNAKRDDGSDYHTTHPFKCLSTPVHMRWSAQSGLEKQGVLSILSSVEAAAT